MTRAALIQTVSSSDVSDNLKRLRSLFIKAKEMKVDLVVLPENFAFMGKVQSSIFGIGETFGFGIIQETIARLAREFKCWVIAGTIPIRGAGERVRASCLVFDDKGICVTRYDKIHLFDVAITKDEVYQESFTFEPGDKPVVVDTPIGRVGLSVCYDLRFPELYRILAQQGAEIFSIPSAFTKATGECHWEVLLRARAIENLCYVLAPNQGGVHDNGRHTYGHSMIVEPWGNIIALQKSDYGVVSVDIDLAHLKKLRKNFPTNQHHVLDSITTEI
jgi:predicted amidohydrolase